MGSQYNKKLPEFLRDLLLEQVDNTAAILSDKSLDFNNVVHDARTGFKKIRAYLLLLRPELGEEIYNIETKSFRTAGKGIADLRDSYVVLMTLEQLLVKYPELVKNISVTDIHGFLAQEYESKQKRAREQDELLKLAGSLQDNKERISNWTLDKDNDGPIFDRLRDRFITCSGQMTDVLAGKSDDKLHNWRKNVKHLWYQVRVFEPVKPDILTAYAESLHSLSDFLGEDHDLVVLHSVVGENTFDEQEKKMGVLRDHIRSERVKLQSGAFTLACTMFSEPSGQFAARIAGYWRNRETFTD